MSPVRKLLVVDDDASVREWLSAFAHRLGYEVATAPSGEAGLVAFEAQRPDVVTLDLVLGGMDGCETLKAMRRIDAGVPVVMLTGHADTRTIVEVVKLGAADFLRKPFAPEELELVLKKAFERGTLEREVDRLRGRPRQGARRAAAGLRDDFLFYGESRSMRNIEEMIDQVADTDLTVLIRGESGTGKELVARSLYRRSNRARRPFVKVNCAALPAALLESELFGYEKGAFTGAQKRKLGKFELANGGTILLDEITEMPPALQAKLLQVLQDGAFSRLGGESDVHVDARIIAATNRDLESSVSDGSFREDLFYRLNVVTLALAPLRERPGDIPLLTDHFLRRYADEYKKPFTAATAELAEQFAAYAWPGNVRELENLAKRIVVLGSEAPVFAELAERIERYPGPLDCAQNDELQRFIAGEIPRVSLKRIGREAAQRAEVQLIGKVLERTRWNRKEAAEILQISYKALLYKMKDAGLADSA